MTGGEAALLTVILSAMGVIFIPTMLMFYRAIVRWTRAEDRLDVLTRDMTILADATNKRLRWLEENIWKRPGR